MGAKDVSSLKPEAQGCEAPRAKHFKPDTSRVYTHDITILCHRHFLVTTIVTSGGTNIRKFEGSFVQQSFDCGDAHFEYGRGQIALTVGGHVANFSQGCFSARWHVQVMAVSNSATTSHSVVWKYISKDSSSASTTCTLCEKVLAYF